MKLILSALLLLALSTSAFAQSERLPKHSYVPEHGFVPDAATAARIAIAVLVPIYGERTINEELPLIATLKDGVWTVVGTLPNGVLGGVAEVEISKATGAVLRVSHGK